MDFFESLKGQQALLLTWDIAVVAAIFIAGVLYGMNAGRKNLISFAITLYGSIVLLELFPFAGEIVSRFPGLAHGIVNLALLAVFVFALYYVFSGSFIRLAFPKARKGTGSFWHILFLGISISGFLTSFVFNDINLLFGREISAFVEEFFLSPTAKFLWAAAPLVAIAVSRRG